MAECSEDVPDGFLIDIYEKSAATGSAVLLADFKSHYPDVYVGRANRFFSNC